MFELQIFPRKIKTLQSLFLKGFFVFDKKNSVKELFLLQFCFTLLNFSSLVTTAANIHLLWVKPLTPQSVMLMELLALTLTRCRAVRGVGGLDETCTLNRISYLCTYNLYDPVCNVYDAGKSITRAIGRVWP